jgi:hypothetical protein
MKDQEYQALIKTLIGLSKDVLDLRASELAMSQIITEILPLIDPQVAQRLAHYPDYADSHRQEILLELEKTNPWLAAHLDADSPTIDDSM